MYTFSMVILFLKRFIGLICLLFGIFALVTPFTPGAWLIFVGLELLGLGFLIPGKLRKLYEAGKARVVAYIK